MPETPPPNEQVISCNLNLAHGFSHPCALYGLSMVARTGNPDAARGHIVAEQDFAAEGTDAAAIPVYLHCGSRALLACHATVEGVTTNYHRAQSPNTGSFDERVLADMQCPHRAWLERHILVPRTDGQDGPSVVK